MSKKQTVASAFTSWRLLIMLLVIILGLYAVISQAGDVSKLKTALQDARINWLLAALGFSLLTFVCAGLMYVVLAPRRLPFGRTILLQMAASFANRLLPGGIGNLGVNFRYLRQEGMDKGQAVSLIGLVPLLGFAAHIILLTGIGFSSAPTLQHVTIAPIVYGVAAGLIGCGVLVCRIPVVANRVKTFLEQLRRSLAHYRRRPNTIGVALIVSAISTLALSACLLCCAHSLNVALSLPEALIVLSSGIVIGTATPTPGGLGGMEVGLVGGAIVLGLSHPEAIAVAVLYRLCTYWLSLFGGGILFFFMRRQNYF